jgi:hypothetical protein
VDRRPFRTIPRHLKRRARALQDLVRRSAAILEQFAVSQEPGPQTQLKSEFDPIGNAECIVDLDPEVANRVFELDVPNSNRTALKLRAFL